MNTKLYIFGAHCNTMYCKSYCDQMVCIQCFGQMVHVHQYQIINQTIMCLLLTLYKMFAGFVF